MVGWSRDRFNEISARLGAFLRQAGYKEQDVFYVPVSGLSGENLTISSEPKLTEWYSGPTLLQAIGTQYFHIFQSQAEAAE
jgi:elongation factor 1 alpha-like protein